MSNRNILISIFFLLVFSIATYAIYHVVTTPKVFNDWEIKCAGACYVKESKKLVTGMVVKYDSRGRLIGESIYEKGKLAKDKHYLYHTNNDGRVISTSLWEKTLDTTTGKIIKNVEYKNGEIVSETVY